MRIANKISFSFLVTGLAVASIVSPIVYSTVKNDLEKTIFAHLETTAHSRTEHIITFLNDDKGKVAMLAESDSVELVLNSYSSGSISFSQVQEKLKHQLQEVLEADEEAFEVFIIDREGKIISSTNDRSVGADKSTDAYFLQGRDRPHIKDVYRSQATGEVGYAISAPIKADQTGELLGVAVFRFSMEDLSAITTDRTGLGESGEIYLINKYKYMITPSRFKKDVILKQKVDTYYANKAIRDFNLYYDPELDEIRGHEHEIKVYPDYRGVRVLGMHGYIPDTQWFLLAEINEEEAFIPLIKLRLLFLMTLLATPVISWLFGTFFAKLITGPITKLHKGIEIIGKGNLNYKVSTDAKDEIGQLSRSFDKMTEDLKTTTTSVHRLDKEVLERRQAESELKVAYDDLKKLQAQLVQTEKMAIIGELSAGVAHEINNPLAVILGETALLLKNKNKDKKLLTTLKTIIEQGERIKLITERLLEFARKRKIPRRAININKALEQSIAFLIYQTKIKNIKIIKEFDSSLPKTFGDKNQLQEVFLNIMFNAVQAMEKGGQLTIKTHITKAQEYGEERELFGPGKKIVAIEFQDTAGGMDEDTLSKIFDPFFSTKAANTGLGLAISHGIIRDHKGLITVQSKPTVGSTFIVKLPIKEGGGR